MASLGLLGPAVVPWLAGVRAVGGLFGAFSTAVLIMAGVGAIPGAIGLVLPALGRTATAEPLEAGSQGGSRRRSTAR